MVQLIVQACVTVRRLQMFSYVVEAVLSGDEKAVVGYGNVAVLL